MTQITFTVHALDARRVAQFMEANEQRIADVVVRHTRRGGRMNWWNWLPKSVQDWRIWRISWLIEFLSGIVTFTLALGILWLLDYGMGALTHQGSAPMHSLGGGIVVNLFAIGLSVFYENVYDARGWELKDVLQRQVGIFATFAVWWFLL